MDADLRTRLGWFAVALLFAAAAVLLYIDYRRIASRVGVSYGKATIGAAAPDVEFETLDGHKVTLRSYAGHPLVVNFFATWCVPCKAELPLFESRFVKMAPKGLAVLGADEQEDGARVRAFVRAHGVTFPVVIDQGPAIDTYGGDAIPTSVFIDSSGVLRAVHVGEMTPGMLDADLQKIL